MTKCYRRVLLLTFVGALHFAVPAAAQTDAVLRWNEIAVDMAASTQNPFAQARTGAIVQLAVFEAVNAIIGSYEAYLDTSIVPDGMSAERVAAASAEAAAIAAAHKVLMTYFGTTPVSAAALSAARASSLASIADGQAEDDGVAIGESAATAMTDLRANDGSAPPQFYEPGAAVAGLWQATPSCPLNPATGLRRGTLLHWREVDTFGIPSVDGFMPGPPPAMNSSAYRKDYNEVMSLGSQNSTERPQDRANVVRFYQLTSPTYLFDKAARQVAAALGAGLGENARALALLNMALSDALVSSFATKYYYVYWRPETAIRAGDTDGNDRTDANPDFVPFIATPCFPSYPSNHGSGAGAGVELLRRLYGAGGHDVRLTNPAVPGIELHYTTLNQIADDVDDARVYGGIHFRFDQEAGGRMGRAIATAVFKNNLRPLDALE